MNKVLLTIITILIPITIISFKNETNFIMEENNLISVVYNNEVINIPINDYLIGVVAGEMPASFNEEALKAQAIASRTYLINKLNENNQYRMSSTTDDQVYINKIEMQEKWKDKYDYYYEKIKKAVEDTDKIVIKYKGEPIKSYYYAQSNGYTESSLNVFNNDLDYFVIKETPYDVDNEKTITLSLNEFKEKLNIVDKDIVINNVIRDESNRVSTISINNKTYTGIDIRKILNLRSTDFTINISDIVNITTKGYGHGVGMSQYGANNMAKEGYNYKEILEYYYENTYLEEI